VGVVGLLTDEILVGNLFFVYAEFMLYYTYKSLVICNGCVHN